MTNIVIKYEPSEEVRKVLRRLSEFHRTGLPLVLKKDERPATIEWAQTLLTAPIARPKYFQEVVRLFRTPLREEESLSWEQVVKAAEEGPQALTDAELACLLVSPDAVEAAGEHLDDLALQGKPPEWLLAELERAGRQYEALREKAKATENPNPATGSRNRRREPVAAPSVKVMGGWADETQLEDETLVTQIASGNATAIAAFYERWYPQFARLATRLIGNSHAGEDIAQDAVVRVILSARLYKKGRPARAWLLAVVYNLVRDWWRKKNVRDAASLDDPIGPDGTVRAIEVAGRDPTAEERAAARERADAMTASLKKLTPDERAVILLRDYAELSAPEAARVLEISVEKVGGRLFRARKRLGGVLQTDWPELFPSQEL